MTRKHRQDVRLEGKKATLVVRRFSLAPLVAVAFVAFVLGSAPTAAAQESLAASCAPTLNTYEGQTGDRVLAQPFFSGLSGTLTRAELELRDFAGDGDWTVAIRAAQPSGTFAGELEPTATVLASATLLDANVPEGDSLQSVVFANPAAVVAGGGYAISITRPAATEANSLAVGAHSPSTECLHRSYLSTNGGTSWFAASTDLIFRVFVPTPASDGPSPDAPQASTPPPDIPQASCKGQLATIVGTSGNDPLTGTPSADVIVGLEGKDTISGLGGKDIICGGTGKDTLKGGSAKDILLGQAGADTLKGGGGNDTCKGGKGRDVEKSC